MLTSYSLFLFRRWARGRSFKNSFDRSHLKAPCTLWVTCWRKCTRLHYPVTVRAHATSNAAPKGFCNSVTNQLLLAADANGNWPVTGQLTHYSVQDRRLNARSLRTETCIPDERLSCSCGGGVATMKGELERLSSSLNRRCLQRTREEVDKETIVC